MSDNGLIDFKALVQNVAKHIESASLTETDNNLLWEMHGFPGLGGGTLRLYSGSPPASRGMTSVEAEHWLHIYLYCLQCAEVDAPTHYHSRIDGALLPVCPKAHELTRGMFQASFLKE